MDNIAHLLWDARQTGFSVPREELEAVTDIKTAYGIQARQIAYSGTRLAGWKLGATAQAAMAVVGLEEPFIGPLPVADVTETGDTIALFPGHSYFAETEVVLELSDRLPPRPEGYTREELGAAIGRWRAAIEIVGLRVEGGPAGLGPRIIADGAGHRATILGPSLDPDEIAPGFPVSLSVNGEVIAEGGPQNFMWEDLRDALGFIVERQNLLAARLQHGDILMTGTMTGMTPVRPGCDVVGRFGDAEVRVTLTEA